MPQAKGAEPYPNWRWISKGYQTPIDWGLTEGFTLALLSTHIENGVHFLLLPCAWTLMKILFIKINSPWSEIAQIPHHMKNRYFAIMKFWYLILLKPEIPMKIYFQFRYAILPILKNRYAISDPPLQGPTNVPVRSNV